MDDLSLCWADEVGLAREVLPRTIHQQVVADLYTNVCVAIRVQLILSDNETVTCVAELLGSGRWEDMHTQTFPPKKLSVHLVLRLVDVKSKNRKSVSVDSEWMQRGL